MKIKPFVFILLILMALAAPVAAQPAHSCGSVAGLSVTFAKVDAGGYAPRANVGSESVFNCIAARDIAFSSQRFNSAWEALNYWFVLYSQELGINLLPLPSPSA